MVPAFTVPEPEPASTPQVIFPFASVSRTEASLHPRTVPMLIPPPETLRPEAKVLVALVLVCKMLPPEMVSPEAEEIPPVVDTEIPPAKVEVAVEEELRPAPSWRSLATERVLAKVEEAEAVMFCARRVEEA